MFDALDRIVRAGCRIVLFSLLLLTLKAAGPRVWEAATQEELLKGRLQNVSLSSEGRLFLAPQFQQVFEIGPGFAFSLCSDPASNLFIGTGSDGKVYKVDGKGTGSLFYQAPEASLFSLTSDSQGNLYVGSSPDGKVYKVSSTGQSVEFFDPKDKYIWAMAFDKAGNLWVATGGRGLLYRVDKTGKGETVYDSEEIHLFSLTFDLEGNAIVGSAPNGLVHRITPAGKALVLLDASQTEIRQVAVDRLGNIYAAALSSASGDSFAAKKEGETKTGLSKAVSQTTGRDSSTSAETTASVTVSTTTTAVSVASIGGTVKGAEKSVLYRIGKDGAVEKIWTSSSDIVYDILCRDDGKVLAATGTRGRILAIDPSRNFTILTEAGEEQIVRLLGLGQTIYAASSNKAALHKLTANRASGGKYESDVFDAGQSSQWGKIWWTLLQPAGGTIEFYTRSGNTEKIDKTWTDWTGPYTQRTGETVKSPLARYIQWKAEFKGSADNSGLLTEKDSLQSVSVSYQQKNIRPVITGFNLLPPGLYLQKPPAPLSSDVVSATGSGSEDPSAVLGTLLSGKNKGFPIPPRRQFHSGARSLSWQASDENKDDLVYHLYFCLENESEWKLLEKDLEDDYYSLESRRLPDGIYRIKVIADDSSDNAYGQGLTGEWISKPFAIDGTAPAVEIVRQGIQGKRAEITLRATDAGDRIYRAEFSVDGSPWRILSPVDGVADSSAEEYSLQTEELSAREHLVGLRVIDTFGNIGMSKVTVKIP